MRSRSVALALPLFFALLAFRPSRADAYEHQWHVGGGLGYAAYIPGKGLPITGTLHGVSASLHLTYGISDTFNLMAQVDGSYHPGPLPVVLGGGSVGAAYIVDILRWVPYFGLMVGANGVWVTGACGDAGERNCSGVRLGAYPLVGLDYQVTRSFTVGAMARYGVMLLGPQGADQSFSGMLRAEYVWGY